MTVLCGTGNARGSTLAKQNHYFYQKPQKTQHTHGKMWGIMILGGYSMGIIPIWDFVH